MVLVVKNLPAKAGDARDADSVHESGRFPGVASGNPLQYSYLENSMNRGAWPSTVHGATESDLIEHTPTNDKLGLNLYYGKCHPNLKNK